MLRTFPTTEEALAAAGQDAPLYCLRPHRIAETAREAIAAFPGEVMYAVKCNDHPVVLQALSEGGVRHWDVASAQEVRGTHTLFPDDRLSFMHPVKTPRAIEEAYFDHGVRVFALDHAEELDKILDATEKADDLTLMVRLGTVAGMALVDLSSKFGIGPKEAAPLLRACRDRAGRAGLTFHVGSQCISASAWIKALELAAQAVDLARVPIDLLDVGGGFPARYRGDEPTFPEVATEIRDALEWITFQGAPKVLCEPGRALVAQGMSAVVRVELRHGDRLYLNDGIYGGLSELKLLGPVFPMRVLRAEGPPPVEEEAVFKFYGPTCDSIDTMPGPFWLPADVRTGDWIEIGMMGAYSNVLRTAFNGFWADRFVQVEDAGPVNEIMPEAARAASPFAG
jgi:ornithine decarboxylase